MEGRARIRKLQAGGYRMTLDYVKTRKDLVGMIAHIAAIEELEPELATQELVDAKFKLIEVYRLIDRWVNNGRIN